MPANLPNLSTTAASNGAYQEAGRAIAKPNNPDGSVADPQLFLSPEFNRAIDGLQTKGTFGSVLQQIQEVRQSATTDLPEVVLATDSVTELTDQAPAASGLIESLATNPILIAAFGTTTNGLASQGDAPATGSETAASLLPDSASSPVPLAQGEIAGNESGLPADQSILALREETNTDQLLTGESPVSIESVGPLTKTSSLNLPSSDTIDAVAAPANEILQFPSTENVQAASASPIASSLKPESNQPETATTQASLKSVEPDVVRHPSYYRKVNLAPTTARSLSSPQQLTGHDQHQPIVQTGVSNIEAIAGGENAPVGDSSATLPFPQTASVTQPHVGQKVDNATATPLPPVAAPTGTLQPTAGADAVATIQTNAAATLVAGQASEDETSNLRPTIASPGNAPVSDGTDRLPESKSDVTTASVPNLNSFRKIYTLPVEEIQQRLQGGATTTNTAVQPAVQNNVEVQGDLLPPDGLWGNDIRSLPVRQSQQPLMDFVSGTHQANHVEPAGGINSALTDVNVPDVNVPNISVSDAGMTIGSMPDGGPAMGVSQKPAATFSPQQLRTDLPSVTIPQLPDVIATEIREATDLHMRTLTLQLHPADLGQITLQVGWEDNLLTAQIITADAAASEVLNRDRQVLLDSLQAAGIDLSSFEVSHRRSDGGSAQDRGDKEAASRERQSNREKQTPDDSSPPPRPKLWQQGSSIDIVA